MLMLMDGMLYPIRQTLYFSVEMLHPIRKHLHFGVQQKPFDTEKVSRSA